jgi:hypothetical protein
MSSGDKISKSEHGGEPAAAEEEQAEPVAKDSAGEPPITFAEFLERAPPYHPRAVTAVRTLEYPPNSSAIAVLCKPELFLYCSNATCRGDRYFRFSGQTVRIARGSGNISAFLSFVCSNCRSTSKTYAIYARWSNEDAEDAATCLKYGEIPQFGPPTPTRLLRMLGQNREIFLKGRQCENQGLGIGAFGYYRRVVENQKNAILDEVIKVATKIAPEMVEALEKAKSEHQFTKAIETVKPAMPQALLINGQNPLTLLHSALSDGLHEQSDKHCLEVAHDIRIVLAELSERISQALKDEAELNESVSRLMRLKGS